MGRRIGVDRPIVIGTRCLERAAGSAIVVYPSVYLQDHIKQNGLAPHEC